MMLKKIKKYGRVKSINVLVYSMDADNATDLGGPKFPYVAQKLSDGKMRYGITDHGTFVHNSFVFPTLRFLKLLKKTGPTIGDCVTNPKYRGQSIYPTMINRIANELFASGIPQVFIIVNHDNESSIRGIQKAGFTLLAHVRAKRFLFFYFGVKITKPA